MDIDSIAPGLDFVQVIEDAVGQCDAPRSSSDSAAWHVGSTCQLMGYSCRLRVRSIIARTASGSRRRGRLFRSEARQK